MNDTAVYEVTFERGYGDGVYRFASLRKTSVKMGDGLSDGPHSPYDGGYDEFFHNELPVTVWVHGYDRAEQRAYEIAVADFPYLTFIEPEADDE